jgi:hypothetical protein
MNAKYFVYMGIIVAAFAIILLIGGSHNAKADKHCAADGGTTYSNYFQCTATLDSSKNLYVTDLRYKTSSGGSNYYDMTYWEYTAYMNMDTNNIYMPEYDYNQGADTNSMNLGYGGDGMIHKAGPAGCSYISVMYTGSVNGKAFYWEQRIQTCDLNPDNKNDYAQFQDLIQFNDSISQNYYINLYHRSWAQPHGSDNPYVYVYKLNPQTASWQEPRNEVAFGAANQYSSGGYNYNVKMKDYSNTYAVNYTGYPNAGDKATATLIYMSADNSGGSTDVLPIFDMNGVDTRQAEQSLWWCNHDYVASSSDFSLVYNKIFPDRSNW